MPKARIRRNLKAATNPSTATTPLPSKKRGRAETGGTDSENPHPPKKTSSGHRIATRIIDDGDESEESNPPSASDSDRDHVEGEVGGGNDEQSDGHQVQQFSVCFFKPCSFVILAEHGYCK